MAKTSLNSSREIADVLKSGRKLSGRYLSFHWKPSDDTKVAITCAKKCLRKAVDRNYFKRLNRAECRERLSSQKLRLMIIARPKISELAKGDLRKVIITAWTSFLDQYSTA